MRPGGGVEVGKVMRGWQEGWGHTQEFVLPVLHAAC